MPLRPKNIQEVHALMAEGTTVLGMRFLGMAAEIKPGTKYTAAGWGDDAWFDYSVPGLLKLNCFFRVTEALYKEVRNTNWAPNNFKRVQRTATRYAKAVNGDVLQNGVSSPTSMNIQSNLGTDMKNEHFEVAVFESFLVNPPQLHVEMKLVSNTLGDKGKPVEALALNAHFD